MRTIQGVGFPVTTVIKPVWTRPEKRKVCIYDHIYIIKRDFCSEI